MYVTQVFPESISPINQVTIQFGLSEPYFGELDASLFSVTMYNIYFPDEPTIDLVVTGIDGLSGNIQAKYFGGAVSGYYGFIVTASDVGRIDTTDINLIVWCRITGITPREGSALGGTLLYIDGENFSSDADDHIVKVGDSTCNIVLSSSE